MNVMDTSRLWHFASLVWAATVEKLTFERGQEALAEWVVVTRRRRLPSTGELERAIGHFVEHYNHPPAARGTAERDAGGRVCGTAGSDPRPPRADQTRDIGAAEARQFDRSIRTATCRECDLLTSPDGPEDSDHVQEAAGLLAKVRRHGGKRHILERKNGEEHE
jgi:hypothetical protein